MARKAFFISVNRYYISPSSKEIELNPSFQQHHDKYCNPYSPDSHIFDNAETPVKICEGLRLIDGTIADVINAETGNNVYRNCETGEIEGFVCTEEE